MKSQPERSSRESKQGGSAWPVLLFWSTLLVGDLLAFPAIASINQNFPAVTPDLAMILFAGCITGQMACMIVVAGWGTRHWLYGLCTASLLGAIAYCLLITGQSWQYQFFFDNNGLALIFAVPLFFLIAAAPFFAFRFLKGWHLARHSPAAWSTQQGVGEIFVAMVVVGSFLFFARASTVVSDLRDNTFWATMGTVGLTVGLYSLLIVLPAALIAWQIKQRSMYWGAVLIFLASAIALWEFVSVRYWGSASITTVNGMVSVIGFIFVPAGVFFTGMWTLRLYGVELYATSRRRTVASREAQTATLPATDGPWNDAPSLETKPDRKRIGRGPRRLAVALFLLAIIGSIYVQAVDGQRRDAELQNNRLGADIAGSGGTITVSARRVTALKLGPDSDDATLRRFTYLKDLNSLDLSGTKITDASFATIRGFTALRELDLSYTNISVQALSNYLATSTVDSLNLAGTKIKAKDMLEFFGVVQALRLSTLDLSYMGWTLDELKQLAPFFSPTLSLRGYGLTDQQLLELFADVDNQVFSIDLSDNQLTVSFLASFAPEQRLVLGKNPIDDATFSSALSSRILTARELSLSNTQLTDASLAVIKSRTAVDTLCLGAGKFTEQGLQDASLNSINKIQLNAQSFTGESLNATRANTYWQSVDLSNSGVSDASLKTIAKLMISSLDLSDTQLTDEALAILADSPLQNEVDLSNTKITAEGLMRGDLKGYQRVVVAAGQFSDEAVTKLRRILRLDVGGELP